MDLIRSLLFDLLLGFFAGASAPGAGPSGVRIRVLCVIRGQISVGRVR